MRHESACFVMNHDDIEKVDFIGFQNSEQDNFNKLLIPGLIISLN